VPHLMLGATEVETGAVATVSTGIVVPYETTEMTSTANLLQFRDSSEPRPLALSTAAMVSARFPILTPAARRGANRYVDGGYFENSGTWLINTLVKSMMQFKLWTTLPDKRIESALRKAQIIVISIRSTPECLTSADRTGCQAVGYDAGGLGEALSPARALLNAGSGHASYSRFDMQSEVSFIKELCMAESNSVPVEASAQGPKTSDACVAGQGYAIGDFNYPLMAIDLGLDTLVGYDVPLTWQLSSASHSLVDNAVDAMVRTDITGVIAPDDAKSASVHLPSEIRLDAARAKDLSAIGGRFEPVLCALGTQKGAEKSFRPWQVCKSL